MRSLQPSGSQKSFSGGPVTHGECTHDPRSTVHFIMHCPFVQVPLQFDPHDPQFDVSVFVFVHDPLQH